MTLRSLLDVPAPAKLNLFLHIVGRRADGMHLLQSPFVLIDWADTLHFELRDDGLLQRHDLSQALPIDDLCLRAARTLQVAAKCRLGVDISIDKRVPAGAGMGGGSSDAATVLLALNRLWGLNWSRSRLEQLGLPLGADVPFFIGGCNAFVEGIGDRVTPMGCPPMHFAVVKPAASLSTAEVFRHPALIRNTELVILAGFSEHAPNAVARSRKISQEDFGRNDLQPPAESLCPQVLQALEWLHERYGNSRMTGSGSAVFARLGDLEVEPVCGSRSHAGPGSGSKSELKTPSASMFPGATLPPEWVGRICRSLAMHPLRGWADEEV